MRSTVIAAVFAALVAPALVVFSPVYFPETLFAVLALGMFVGIAGRPSSFGAVAVACAVASGVVFVMGLVLFFRPFTGLVVVSGALAVGLWLFVPLTIGAAVGIVVRRRFPRAAVAVGAAGVVAVAALGVLLMFVVAPREAADAPDCAGGHECARTMCQMMAERRRLFALERVTQYGAGTVTCVYTAWGGVHVGTAYATSRSMSWDDGWWPHALRFWTP